MTSWTGYGPVLYALFVWWFSTGLILYLDGLPRRTFRRSLAVATGVAVLALIGLAATRSMTTVAGAYVAFTCAILVWGWHEMTFLMGLVTGPRREACAEPCRGVRHVGHAVATVLHHELALLAGVLGCGALAGLFPAWRAYRYSVADGMTIRI